MKWVRIFLGWGFLTILCVSSVLSHENDRLFGHVNYKVADDTIIIFYDLFTQPSADTLWLSPVFACQKPIIDSPAVGDQDYILYPATLISSDVAPGYLIEQGPSGLRVKGRVKISLGGQCLPRGCEVYASAPDYSGLEDKWVEFYNNGALSFSFIPSLGVAYYNTSFDDETDNNGIAWGMDFFATYDIRHVQLAGSYRFTTGDDFVVKEAIPLKLSYYLGNRGDFLPSFSVAAKWSALHSTTGDFDFEKKQWGGEAGIAIDGPFERLSYSYCNALGGYHKFGLTLHRIRIGSWTMGTQYEYYRFDNTDMFRITGSFAEGSNFATGLGIGHGATDLQWHNDRPWWYKGVSYAGVLILPAAAIAGIIYIFGGGLID